MHFDVEASVKKSERHSVEGEAFGQKMRAPGAGRPPKYGEQTRSIPVPMSITTGQITSLPELQRIPSLPALAALSDIPLPLPEAGCDHM
ncbi:MAG TPA: hypothetical protein V6D30_23940 [Leptolyngbyaceae cyanobacterium]